MAYDAMGNYTGYEDPYADQLRREEEDRKKREQELANTAVHKQESTVYGDGSQEHKTVITTPAPQAQPVYQAPPVARTLTANEQVVPQPVAPVLPNQEQYNASIAQQESGNKPNIGYHNPQASTAYGTYGITAPAYQDARKLNPNLPADITQATPEQQNQAMNAFTAQNARYLKNYGVEPTQQNLQAAHFLGAKGLADYLRDGTISPQAAAANGGEEAVRKIVNARLGGQVAPASGAVNQAPAQAQTQPQVAAPVNPTQPQIQIDDNGNKLITNTDGTTTLLGPDNRPMIAGGQVPVNTEQYKARLLAEGLNDPSKAYQIYQNPKEYGEAASLAAGKQVFDSMKQNQLSAEADKQLKQYAAQAAGGDPGASRKLADVFAGKDKTEEGSYMKMLMMHFFLGADAGKQYAQDYLGHGSKWDSTEITDKDGNKRAVAVKFSANGQPMSGIDVATNRALTGDEIAQAIGSGAHAGGGAKQKPEVSTQDVEKNGMKGRVVTEFKNGKTNTYVESGGKTYAYDATWKPVSISTAAEKGVNAAQTKANYAEITAALTGQGKVKGELAQYGYAVTQGANGQTIVTKDGAPVQTDANGQIAITDKAGKPVTLASLQTAQAIEQAGGKAEAEAVGKATGATKAQDVKNQYFANESHGLIKPINDAIRESTGSGIGTKVDQLAGMIGASPKGAQAIAKLDVLSYSLLANVPRFEGPQSDRDVAIYSKAAGDFANSDKPVATRLAALDAMVTLLKKYDKEGKNDWTFGTAGEVDRSNPLLKKK